MSTRNSRHDKQLRPHANRLDTSSPTNDTAVILSKINHLTLEILTKLNHEIDPIISIPNNSSASLSYNSAYNATTTQPSSSSSLPSSSSIKSICNLSTCRSYTSTLLLLSYIQKLVQHKKSTTTRELYYQFVTHFRSQRECDSIINDICNMLFVERVHLGLYASPKGWFCGSFVITEYSEEKVCPVDLNDGTLFNIADDKYDDDHCGENNNTLRKNVIDGTKLSSIQGIPITREWLVRSTPITPVYSSLSHDDDDHHHHHASSSDASLSPTESTSPSSTSNYTIQSNAKCILVIEKEGIYLRLSEDRFFDKYPCIIITGKGYPDIATRALVHVLHSHLNIPVYGLCDCNPFGVNVLATYYRGSQKRHCDGGERYSVPMQWIGLRPSFVQKLKKEKALPDEVYQKLTDLDRKKVAKICNERNAFVHGHSRGIENDGLEGARLEELELMVELGFKVELESLYWLGLEYISAWLLNSLMFNENHLSRRRKNGDIGRNEDTFRDIDDEERDEYYLRIAI